MQWIHLSMLDVDRDHGAAFDRWYRHEHLACVLRQPGWRRAHRYECADGCPGYLTIHELDATAFDSARPLSAVPFRDESVGRRIRNYHAETFRLTDAAGEMSDAPALLNVISTEVEPRHAAAFGAWYRDVHVPEIVGCPGWACARRYVSVEVPTRFLAMYELEDEERPFSSPEYEAAVGWDEHVGHLRGYHGFRVYRHRYTVG